MIHRLTAICLFSLTLFTAPTAMAEEAGWISPESVDGAQTVSAAEAKALFDAGATFVDVRNPRYFARRHVPNAHHLDLKTDFNEQALAAIATTDTPVVIYCSGVKCARSKNATELAVSWGYTNVKYFRGGIVDWRDAGYPMDSAN